MKPPSRNAGCLTLALAGLAWGAVLTLIGLGVEAVIRHWIAP